MRPPTFSKGCEQFAGSLLKESHQAASFRAGIGRLEGTESEPREVTPCPLAPAALTAFRRVVTVMADALAGDFDHVAIDDAGRAGDVGQGDSREQHQREGQGAWCQV